MPARFDQLLEMAKKELKKSNGDVFFEAEFSKETNCILVHWIGIQTIETIMLGANQLLQMLREKPCPKILNSTRELIGPWNDGAAFLGHKWAIKAKLAGIKHFAHVLAPGIYGRKSFQFFFDAGTHHFEIMSFETESEAQRWLQRQ